MRVLIADDDDVVRTLLENLVTGWGYEVITAGDGEKALSVLEDSDSPVLAVIDWMMPGKTGLEICTCVKADDAPGYTYIILLTSKGEKSDIITGLDAGADDFLTKPVDPAELKSRLAVGARTADYEHLLIQKNRQLDDKNMELARYGESMKNLAREREIFLQAFENSVQGMCITDVRGTITRANQSFLQQYGYTEEEIRGQNSRALNPGIEAYSDFGIPPDQYEKMFRELWRDIRDPATGRWEGMLPNRTRDGRILWVHLIISAIRNVQSDLIGFLGMPVDMTERIEREFKIRLDIYQAITALAEKRDNETGLHLKRVSEYAGLLARTIGLSRKFCEDIAIFAPLHDIGKVGITDSILLAPRKLTAEEFEIMKTHATIGYDIMKDRPTMEMGAEIAWTHHEKWDGSGYPRGLKGEDIPVSGRIVALTDVYDALRSRRVYKEPWTHEKTRDIILEGRGAHFAPEVVGAFLEVEAEICAIFDNNADPDEI
jgi:PAS domain S-box-containing protein